MSRINEANERVRLEEWEQMYREFLASGKTIKEWCEEIGIARTTFHRRLRQMREAAAEAKHEIIAVNTAADEQHHITESEGKIRINGRGISVELPTYVSPELLAVLLKGLSSC